MVAIMEKRGMNVWTKLGENESAYSLQETSEHHENSSDGHFKFLLAF